MQGFCLCQKNKSSIVCQTKFSCGDTDVKLIKSSCVLHNLLMLMKLEWNISYFDRPFLFYEKKLFSVALKMWSHNAIFHLIFNRLSQVSWLELIAEVVTYDTILQSIFDYNLYSIYLYIYIWEKVIAMSWFSPESIENRKHFRFSVDFRPCDPLSTWIVTPCYFSRKRIGWGNVMENGIMWPHIKNVAHVTCDAAVLCGYHWCISYTQALH